MPHAPPASRGRISTIDRDFIVITSWLQPFFMMGFRENPAESGGRVVARQVYTMPIPGGLFEGWAVIYTLVHYDRRSKDTIIKQLVLTLDKHLRAIKGDAYVA